MERIILQEDENEDVLVPTEPTNDSTGINNDNHALAIIVAIKLRIRIIITITRR
jgi:hypothetical protein